MAILTVETSGENEKLPKLINLYHAQMYHTQIKHGLNDVKTALQGQLLPSDSRKILEQNRNHGMAKLRTLPLNLPTTNELANLTEQDLNGEWTKITHTPNTYYIVSNATPSKILPYIVLLANPNLTDKSKAVQFNHTPTPLAKTNSKTFHYNKENRADVQLWTTTPHEWAGVDAMLVSLVKNIANDKLKLTLRDEKLGIYRLSFDSTLNVNTNNIESHLKFTTSPDKADEMIAHAKAVLSDLPNQISQDDIAKAKTALALQEKSRLENPQTWLNRLMLADRQGDDLAYLADATHLTDHITPDNIKRMAEQIYNNKSVQVWVDLPQ